jgi:hypothetical protein
MAGTMGKVGRTAAWLAAAAAMAVTGAVQAQQTPGQINDPSSYQGSMRLQEQERAREAQVQQQNTQMLNNMNAQYAPPPGASAGGGGGGGRAPAPINWRARPPLAPAQNKLLGRWQQIEAAPLLTAQDITSSSIGGGLLFPGAAEAASSILTGMLAGGCNSIFGKGVISFEPTALQWVAPDGHREILNHVEYRADGANVVMLSNDPDAIPWLIFGFPSGDHAVVAALNCTMKKVSATATTAPATTARTTVASAGNVPGPQSGGAAGKGWVLLKAGTTVPGDFIPIGDAVFYIVREDPDVTLAKAGFTGPSPSNAWLTACKTDEARCNVGGRAMAANRVGDMRTNVDGNAEVPDLPPGRYFIFGRAIYQGKTMVWLRPLVVQPGYNRVVFEPKEGSTG